MEWHSMKLHLKSHYKAFNVHQYFRYILQLIYQLIFFYTYNFYNVNILQHHIIYHTHTHSSSGNVCCLVRFLIGSKEIQKNLYLETFFNMF